MCFFNEIFLSEIEVIDLLNSGYTCCYQALCLNRYIL